MVRSVECRLVWLAAFLVNQSSHPGSRMVEDCAKSADKALDEYQTRFPAFTISDIPSA